MMRLLARMHGQEAPEPAGLDGRTWRTLALGAVTSSIVIVHLVALGFGGAVLFLRSGTGYSGGETVALIVMSTVAVLAFWRAGSLIVRRRRRPAAESDVR